MENTGWIKLFRKILKWGWYGSVNTRLVFFHLLLTANQKTSIWKDIKVEAGERICGRNKLAEEVGISSNSVRRALSNLQKTNEITIKSTNKFSLIHLNNWFIYQDKTPAKEPTKDQQKTTSKEERRKNNKKEIYKEKRNVTEDKILEIAEKYGVSQKTVEEKYQDLILYCQSKGKTYKDYSAALMTWIRNDLKAGKIRPVVKTTLPQVEQISEAQRISNLKRLEEIKARMPLVKRI